MAKKNTHTLKGDLRTAIQALLEQEYITEGETRTGAETIAAALYQQASDPESPYFGKALDIIVKLTDQQDQLKADKMRFELARVTEPTIYELDTDPTTEATREHIRERLTSL